MRREITVGQPGGQPRIVGQHRPGADDDRVEPAALVVHSGTRFRSGNPLAGSVLRGAPAVERRRVLPRHMGPAGACPVKPGPQRAVDDGVGPESRMHRDPRGTQGLCSSPCHRTGVRDGVVHRRDSGVDERAGAGSGASGVVARLEGDHGGAAACPVAGRSQGPHFRVRTARRRCGTYPGDLPVRVEDHGADRRVRAGGSPHGLRRIQRELKCLGDFGGRHVASVRCGEAAAACARSLRTASAGSSAP